VIGPYFLREMEEQMIKIKQNLKVSQDRHKNYVDRVELTGNLKWETM
jgi:hypothetical protein